MKRLNLGCGKDYLRNYFNIDNNPTHRPDLLYDLNQIPYPLKSNQFDFVRMKMILEHLDKPIEVLKEVVRICKNNALIEVTVPHANSYANITDIQHKHSFTENSFNEKMLEMYGLKELWLESKEFIFKNKWKKFIPFKWFFKLFLNGIYDDIKFTFIIEKKNGK